MTAPITTLELVQEITAPPLLCERLFSIKGLADECPGISYCQLKTWVDNRRTNGLAEFDAIYRVNGNKFMLDRDAFCRWLESRMERLAER